jgi:methionine-R-sulfoxide reductase
MGEYTWGMAKIHKSDAEWREQLSEEQYAVLRGKATEPPFSGNLDRSKEGTYSCVACGVKLFDNTQLYKSKQHGLEGWPSFSDVLNADTVVLSNDYSYGMHRIEVSCANCGGHLGHYFEDNSSPTGQHYCLNAVTLDFKPKK